MKQKNIDIISRYLESHEDVDPELEKEFANLFCDSGKEKDIKSLMMQDWQNMLLNSSENKDMSHVMRRIEQIIDSEKSQPLTKNSRKINSIYTWYSRIAAILILPLLLWAAYNVSQRDTLPLASTTLPPSKVQVFSPLGSRVHFDLPDGSSGWLNSGSKLEYKIPFDERKIMVEGEAFLDITTDPLRPFTVEGPHSFVKVFGTKFNVQMWPEQVTTEVMLVEGSVEMIPKNSDESFMMKPGDLFKYDKNKNKLTRKQANPNYYTSWITGKLVLRNVNIKQMADELSRWFNVEVDIDSIMLSDHIFRATFEDEKLEEVLRLLKMTAPIEYNIIDNQQRNNGEFARKKVAIRYHKK